MSGYARADGAPHDPPPDRFRIEIAVCDAREHTLALFSRSTLPEREHEGVTYERARLGAALAGEGDDWTTIHLRCKRKRCPCHVQVSRPLLEAALAAMWKPYAIASARRIWDSPCH